jgi:hypothetical protein
MDFLSPHGRELAHHMGITLPAPALPAVPKPEQTPPKQGTRVMRGLARLTNLTNSVIAQMDKVADDLATDIQKSADEIKGCMDGFTTVRDQMTQTATEAKAVLNQLTNGAPGNPTSPPPLTGS